MFGVNKKVRRYGNHVQECAGNCTDLGFLGCPWPGDPCRSRWWTVKSRTAAGEARAASFVLAPSNVRTAALADAIATKSHKSWRKAVQKLCQNENSPQLGFSSNAPKSKL